MLLLRVTTTLTLAGSLLLSLAISTPAPTLAAEAIVTDCTRGGLANAMNEAATSDPNNPGFVTFDCDDNTIEFSNGETILIGGSSTFAVTIDGRNSSGSSINFDGGDTANFFRVNTNGYLTIKNLTLQHGNAPAQGDSAQKQGGAIDVDGTGSLTVIASTFIDNQADYGAAIENDAGTIEIIQSTFSDNHGDYGGAIGNNVGTLTVTQSSFTQNKVDFHGGAILNGGVAEITQSSFTENRTASFGGAILNNGSLKVSQSSFVKNHADDHAGAIDMVGGSAQIRTSTFSGNTAGSHGSAVYVHSDLDTAAIYWSTIVQPENTSRALYLYSDLTLGGVLLGGNGDHCGFGGGSIIDTYSIANDDTCGLTDNGSTQGYDSLGLDPLSNITIHGVDQSYYPLQAISPAVKPGQLFCDTDMDQDSDNDPDQLGNSRPISGGCDIGAVERGNTPPAIASLALAPIQIDEGSSISVAITDVDNDTLAISIDCDTNDLSPAVSTDSPATCSYPDNGIFITQVSASDGFASTNTRHFSVNVLDVKPAMTMLTPTPALVAINQIVNLQTTATGATTDTIDFTYNCGIGADIDTAAISLTAGTFTAEAGCTYLATGIYTLKAMATDDDDNESDPIFAVVQVVTPTSLCANQWSGALRVSHTCSRSETQIVLPQDGPQTLCVNQWNGSASLGSNCGRGEYAVVVNGDQSEPACVNSWNGALRVSDRCSRNERQVWL